MLGNIMFLKCNYKLGLAQKLEQIRKDFKLFFQIKINNRRSKKSSSNLRRLFFWQSDLPLPCQIE